MHGLPWVKSTAKGVKDEIFLYLCKHGRLPFDQKFQNFETGTNGMEISRKEKFRKFGYTSRGCPLLRNLCKFAIFYSALASSFGRDHSELDISCKDDAHSIKETL